jgi:hypothetical protein
MGGVVAADPRTGLIALGRVAVSFSVFRMLKRSAAA